ncbi:MAG: endo-1,4-beta-xylanase [Fibrobacteria bacterium]|nr:endo-1,4-beta-xylanase [Fibrobacteria bacterium]
MTTAFLFLFALLLAGPENRIGSNPGFESGTLDWVVWTEDSVVSGELRLEAVDSLAPEGAHFGRVDLATGRGRSRRSSLRLASPPWSAAPLSRYSIRFQARGPASIFVAFHDGSRNWRELGGFEVPLTPQWRTFQGEWITDRQTAGPLRAVFHVGARAGRIDLDDLVVEDLGWVDTTWYEGADRRIDSLRRVSQVVVVRDSAGIAQGGKALHLRLHRHAFPFGTAIAFSRQEPPSEDELWYRRTAASLFNAATVESDFKWPRYESVEGNPDTAQIERYLRWGDSLGIPLRAHALVWGIQAGGFDTFWATDTHLLSCARIAENIRSRIQRDMARFQGRIQDYDVWNEAIHEPAFLDACQDDPRFAPEGRALQDSAFRWARSADPTARLWINEYGNLEGDDNEALFQEVRSMLDRGTPVDGIGVQGHFGGQDIDPVLVGARLDRLATLGLPIRVTEFDNERRAGVAAFDEEGQAVQFSRFLRLAYSHPAVDGIHLWGFWDRQHWLHAMNPEVSPGMWTVDRRPKPVVDSVRRLWGREWGLDTTIILDAGGRAALRVVPGRYRIELEGASFRDVELLGGDAVFSLPDLPDGTARPSARSGRVRVVAGRGAVVLERADHGDALVVEVWDVRRRRVAREIFGTGRTSLRIALPAAGFHVVRILGENGASRHPFVSPP